MNLCTIVAKNYIAQARVLAKSFRVHHPNGRCFVLIVDDFDDFDDLDAIDPSAEAFEIVRTEEIGLDRETLLLMATIYDVLELSTALKPSLLAALLARLGEPVLYLDPDIQVFDSLQDVHRLAAEHGLVLTPHLLEPLPCDGRNPSEVTIIASGSYNLGFVAVGPGADTDKLLRWWIRRLRHDCIVDHPMGLFVDQRWFDLAPSLVGDLHILRDPGYNVAYWNLANRPVAALDDGGYAVRGRPLRFFHYSGYDPARPHLISKHQDRHSLADEPVLRELFDGYQLALMAEGQAVAGRRSYGYDVMADGSALTLALRKIFRQGELAGKLERSVFSDQGLDRFFEWLREPAHPGGAFGVNQLLAELHHARLDLRTAFPDLAVASHAEGLVRWAHVHGRADVPIPEHLLPALAVDSVAGDPPASGGDEVGTDVPGPQAWGVNVSGYLRSELGVGEAARLAIRALDAAGVPVMPVHGRDVPGSRQQHAFVHVAPRLAPFAVNLICVNADRLPRFLADAGPEFVDGRYQIGMWWWEVGTFPPHWCGAFELLDEIWVGTRHIADALAPISPIPVVRIPIPVVVAPPPPRSRAELGLPDGFLFLFLFDLNSVLERKNPLGLIEAFARAFPAGSGASLAIKCINSEYHPEQAEQLRVAAARHPDVHLLERYVSAADKDAMIASAQCYVSLHRSEGLGLTLAEAMYLGKPVIATAYSGNLDFMTESNSYLVPLTMRPIGPGNDPYPRDGEWADPDLDEAARLMLRVMADPGAAEQRGARGAAEIRATQSVAAAGQQMRGRLELVHHRLRAHPRTAPSTPPPAVELSRARGLIGAGPRSGGRLPLGALAKRAAERLLRYRAVHQREIDEHLLAAIQCHEASIRAGDGRAGELSALALGELRRQDDAIAGVRAELDRSNDLLTVAQRMVRELRARPDPAFLPFGTFDAGVVGRVYGYRPGEIDSHASASGYVAFENMFRGDEELIRRRQAVYVGLIGDREPVLDAGCGRGEFLDLLRDSGLECSGVDADPGMVARCREKGHRRVEQGDLNAHLRGLGDGSLGAIFCAQVIEHLAVDELVAFLERAASKLRADGIFIAETVNPHCAQALKAFWLDLTHEQPIFPEAALALCAGAGFGSAYVFHPNASGDVDADRFESGDYALVATVPRRPLS